MPKGVGVQIIPPWRLREEEKTGKKRPASAGPSARILEPAGPKAKAESAKPPGSPPKPARDVTHFILQAHEVQIGDALLCDDWNRELELREERNQIIKAMLKDGKTVAYRQSGSSLAPRVKSNDCCCYMPVRFDASVEEDDIVFCEVQPKGYFYAHLVRRKEWKNKRWVYTISNLAGRINGWCHLEHIHGRLFQVMR